MKSILVAGAGSYLGESFRNYMGRYSSAYHVECLDLVSNTWENADFSDYDAIYQVAGIAHIKETEDNKELYYQVNRDLAVRVARKAKDSGVKQFIYLSSMSVYGLDVGIITPSTELNPQNHYSISKAQAEEQLKALESTSFRIAILRPPMVYGKGCKGNFNELELLALKLPIFPMVKNQRSLLYIDNLCEFVKMIIDNGESGIFFPQNREYVCTYDMARIIAQCNGKRLLPSRLMGLIINLLHKHVRKVRKAFGTLIYQNTETMDFAYCVVRFEDSIREIYK